MFWKLDLISSVWGLNLMSCSPFESQSDPWDWRDPRKVCYCRDWETISLFFWICQTERLEMNNKTSRNISVGGGNCLTTTMILFRPRQYVEPVSSYLIKVKVHWNFPVETGLLTRKAIKKIISRAWQWWGLKLWFLNFPGWNMLELFFFIFPQSFNWDQFRRLWPIIKFWFWIKTFFWSVRLNFFNVIISFGFWFSAEFFAETFYRFQTDFLNFFLKFLRIK